MLSVLVGHSYFLRFDPKQLARAKPYPPLATLQVAAMLRHAGHRVTLFDAMLAVGLDDYDRELRATGPQLVVLYEDNFNYLTKMCLGRMREAACHMIEAARRDGARVIVAGSDASDAPQAYLTAGAEVILLGEGLSALPALIQRLDADPNIAGNDWVGGLQGVAWKMDERVVRHGALAPVANSRSLHRPAWDLVDIERYRTLWREAHGYFSLNMVASRGCSFRCTWCAKPIWGNRYLQRKPAEVAAEMRDIKRDFAPDRIWFADDIFGFRVEWIDRFAEALRSFDGGIPFTIQTRADLISARMAAALREAGCAEAWLGAESGSQRILDAMRKGTTVEEIVTARQRLHAQHIRVGFFIQLGYLDEQLADILATRALIERAQPDDIGVSVAYPLPGTQFYEVVKAQLSRKTHWRDSGDLAMMFQGTFDSDVYRTVRDLLHEQVSLEQGPPVRDLDYRQAKQALEERWQALILSAQAHRSDEPHRAAMSGYG